MLVSCCCKAPKADINIFLGEIETFFIPVCKRKSVFLIGDFNLNLLNDKLLLDTVFSLGMYPLINKPTRITSHSATIIDNIFTGQLQSQLTSGIVVDDVSDHLPIFCLYDLDCLLGL